MEDRLWEAAQEEANQSGKAIEPAAEARLKEMISDGVDRMNTLGVANDPSQIQRAEKNIVRFVREMNNIRLGQGDLGVASYNAARDICPLWPFC
ncbi:hypothetical protein GJ633_08530 [Halorubrum sp. CBA1125]|uniref:hypothetical protein n=1 Tax=Halorubrum sp. CBA1125 TaxID=2668072 RepID=UPI0012E8DCA1|nr:hypothetical protein [Halorubrum sp. CBA1125]MUW14704.1 hypothetical protein [Halorubrum sp. CBA1125]